MKVFGWLTLCEKIITLDFVSGDNFFPRLLIYPNTFIQGQYVNNTTLFQIYRMCGACESNQIVKT
jgi:hypothetical protein